MSYLIPALLNKIPEKLIEPLREHPPIWASKSGVRREKKKRKKFTANRERKYQLDFKI